MKKLDAKQIKELSEKVTTSLLKDKNKEALLGALVGTIVETILSDADTLEALSALLPSEPAKTTTKKASTTTKKRAKEAAVLNPFEVFQEGEAVLKARLEALEVPQLKDIIRDYDLDPYKKVSNCRKAERFINQILETVSARAKAGTGYKNSL